MYIRVNIYIIEYNYFSPAVEFHKLLSACYTCAEQEARKYCCPMIYKRQKRLQNISGKMVRK